MATTVYLMKFKSGNQVSIPFVEVKNFLSQYGKIGKGFAELEVTFPPDVIGDLCSVVCDDNGDVACISIDRPIYGNCFRKFAFEIMKKFDLTFLDSGLQEIYLFGSIATDIPQSIMDEAEGSPVTIARFDDIWPNP